MFDVSFTRIALDDAAIDEMLHGAPGHVGRYMRRKARQHVTASKALAGKRTGRLVRSISWEQRRLKSSQRITITADVSYAYYHHEGTAPHKQQQGRHPGSRANPFLTAPIRPVWRT